MLGCFFFNWFLLLDGIWLFFSGWFKEGWLLLPIIRLLVIIFLEREWEEEREWEDEYVALLYCHYRLAFLSNSILFLCQIFALVMCFLVSWF
jgi:hypothetical protein